MKEVIEFDFKLASRILEIVGDSVVDINCIIDQVEISRDSVMKVIHGLERSRRIEIKKFDIGNGALLELVKKTTNQTQVIDSDEYFFPRPSFD